MIHLANITHIMPNGVCVRGPGETLVRVGDAATGEG